MTSFLFLFIIIVISGRIAAREEGIHLIACLLYLPGGLVGFCRTRDDGSEGGVPWGVSRDVDRVAHAT